MKTTVNNYQFHRAFEEMNRTNNFSYGGLNALFDYLEDYEENTGEEMELDVIALCCDFSEYESVQAFTNDYGYDDYVVYDDAMAIDYQATLDKISEATTVIDIDGESFIIQQF